MGPEKLAVEAHGFLIGFLLAKRERSARIGALVKLLWADMEPTPLRMDLNPLMVTHVL